MLLSSIFLVTVSLCYLWRLRVTSTNFNEKKEAKPNIIWWSPDNFKPNSNRIVFMGARGRTPLAMMRQACAIESTARYNPDRPIQLFISADDQDGIGKPLGYDTDPWISVLDQFPNVDIVLYNETDYFDGTPMESWYKEGVWRKSQFKHAHYSDYVRFLTVYRGGGLYMDLDFITLKRLDDKIFWNFVSAEDESHLHIPNAIFHFEHGHRLLEPMMTHFLWMAYNPDDYTTHGPKFMKSFFTSYCGLRMEDLIAKKCLDVRFLPHHYFFPIAWQQWNKYFKEAENETMEDIKKSYGVHVWNKKSRDAEVKFESKQVYATLVNTHCPFTRRLNSKD